MYELAFYRADAPGATRWDRIIANYTKGPYSHVEFVLPSGRCFSSSPRDGGTRFKWIDLNDESTWKKVRVGSGRISTYESGPELITQWCQQEIPSKYDWWGILGFGAPALRHIRGQSRYNWICSEICTTLVQFIGYGEGLIPFDVHPNWLHDYVVNVNKFS